MNYHTITYPDQNNGDGLRVVLWLSGCSHHCFNCQNHQTWDINSGIPFDESAKEELFRELDKDYISGLTLSGGDPLHEANLDGVLDLVNEIRLLFPNKSIWLYTGYEVKIKKYPYVDGNDDYKIKNQYNFVITQPSKDARKNLIRNGIINSIDVLVDGKYIDSQRDITLKWRGSKNQRVIDIQKSLQQNKLILYCD